MSYLQQKKSVLKKVLLATTIISTVGVSAVLASTAEKASADLSKEFVDLQKQISDLKKEIGQLKEEQKKTASDTAKQETVGHNPDSASRREILRLKEKVEALEIGQRQSEQVAAKISKEEILAEEPWLKTPDGYIHVKGSDTGFKLGGRVRLDTMYDPGTNLGTDSIFPKTVPLKGIDNGASSSGHTQANMRQSRLNFASLTPTEKGDVRTFIELDFWGNGTTGTNYTPRLRHAYGTFKQILAGQTDSVFYDGNGETLDFNSITGASLRLPQIRFTQALINNFKVIVALEKPATDYTGYTPATTNTGATLTTYASNDSSGSLGKSSLPDLTSSIGWSGTPGSFALRGVVRQLNVKSIGNANASNDFSAKATAWGLGVSALLYTQDKSNIFAQVNFGDGVGRYIPEAAGQAAAFDPSNRIFEKLHATNGIVGYQHFWCDHIRTNVMASYTRITEAKDPIATAALASTTSRMNGTIRKIFANIIYSPVKNVETGIEVAYVKRTTTDDKNGQGMRLQLSLNYTF